jgi:uncharacterized phage protein (TIGR01671 family)
MSKTREIKFRVWHKDGRKKPDKWMRGPFDLIDFANDQSGYEPANKYWDGYGEEWVFMQFTGLHDKNGREIYEGDITRDREGSLGVIQFYDVAPYAQFGTQHHDFEVYYDDSDTWWSDEIPDDCEVIGNIYENPELLEAK